MFEIKEIIKRFNKEELGIIIQTDKRGSLLEFNCDGWISYISESKFKKLIKQGKVVKL